MAVTWIAAKIGCSCYSLLAWVKKAKVDKGTRAGAPPKLTDARHWSARTVNCAGQRDPAQGFCIFYPGGARPPTEAMTAFIDEYRGDYGVEPIREVLPTAPSTGADHCGRSKPSNTPRSNGSTGSTTGVCWSRSATSRPPKPKNDATPCWTKLPWQHNSIQIASSNLGAVHLAEFIHIERWANQRGERALGGSPLWRYHVVDRRDVLHFGLGVVVPAAYRDAANVNFIARDGDSRASGPTQAFLTSADGASSIGVADGGTVQSAISIAHTPVELLGSAVRPVEGSTIRTANGFAYAVAAADSIDHDLITAGGVKLHYLPGPGVVNAVAFGAMGDGVTDNTAALQAALDFAAKDAGAIRSVYVPAGIYRTRTLYVPLGVRLYGDGGAAQSTANSTTRLVQNGPGDVIRFKGYHSGPRRYWWGEIDHLTIWGDLAQRSGWGINFKDISGNAVLPQDSNFLHHLTIRRCREGGINVPSGAFPMCIADSALLFNDGPGIKLTRETTFQSVHFFNISGDGNNGGLISLDRLNDGSGSVLVTNLKSEARLNFDHGNVEHQLHAIEINDCGGCPVVIQGATHSSSIPEGRAFKKPGDLVHIRAGGMPEIRWAGVALRVRSTDRGADPAIVGGRDIPPSTRASYRQTSGSFGGSHRFSNASLALSWGSTSDGAMSPSVAGQNALLLNNDSPTSILTFADATDGQVLHVIAESGKSTLVNGALMRLAGQNDFAMSENDSCTLIYIAGVWRELGRNTGR